MDPYEALAELVKAVEVGDFGKARIVLDDLYDHRAGGGSLPLGIRLVMRSELLDNPCKQGVSSSHEPE